MSETVSAGEGAYRGAGKRPGGLPFVLACVVVAAVGLAPWLMAAMFAPALLGAPGPSPGPLTILGIAAVLAYPVWLIYWGGRVLSARRSGETGRAQAAVMVAPAVMLIAVFSFFSFGP